MLADEAEPYIKAFRQADFMLRIQTGNAAFSSLLVSA
jgi:hypothetical protein